MATKVCERYKRSKSYWFYFATFVQSCLKNISWIVCIAIRSASCSIFDKEPVISCLLYQCIFLLLNWTYISKISLCLLFKTLSGCSILHCYNVMKDFLQDLRAIHIVHWSDNVIWVCRSPALSKSQHMTRHMTWCMIAHWRALIELLLLVIGSSDFQPKNVSQC